MMLLYCCESADLPAGGDALLMLRENASAWPPSWRRRRAEIDRSFMIWSGVFCGPSIGWGFDRRTKSIVSPSVRSRSVGRRRSREVFLRTKHNTQHHNITMLIEPRRTVAAAHHTTAVGILANRLLNKAAWLKLANFFITINISCSPPISSHAEAEAEAIVASAA